MKLISVMDGNLLEEGAWLHFTDPRDGEPMFRDAAKTLPCKARVRSNMSKTYRSANMREVQKNQSLIARAKKADRERIQNEAIDHSQTVWFAIAVTALENCVADQPGIVSPTFEQLLEIGDDGESQWMVNQVIAFSGDGANYGLAPADPTPAGDGKKKPTSKGSSAS